MTYFIAGEVLRHVVLAVTIRLRALVPFKPSGVTFHWQCSILNCWREACVQSSHLIGMSQTDKCRSRISVRCDRAVGQCHFPARHSLQRYNSMVWMCISETVESKNVQTGHVNEEIKAVR